MGSDQIHKNWHWNNNTSAKSKKNNVYNLKNDNQQRECLLEINFTRPLDMQYKIFITNMNLTKALIVFITKLTKDARIFHILSY